VLILYVLQRQQGLRNPSQDLILGDAVIRILRLLNFLRQIAALAIIHEDEKPSVLNKAFPMPHNVRMFKLSQQGRFLHCILSLLGGVAAQIHHLTSGRRCPVVA
jgi:hypothetical protein